LPDLYDDFGVASSWLFIIFSVVNTVLGLHDLYETLQAQKLGLCTIERSEVLECLLNILSAMLFTIGSCLGLPEVSDKLTDFMWDDVFSVVGSALLVVSAFYNALGMAAEKTETLSSRICLFCTLMGAVMFTIGSWLYLPEIVDVSDAYSQGTWLYILGSVLFTVGGSISVMLVSVASKTKGREEKRSAEERD